MRAYEYGKIPRPAVAIIGSFDPLIEHHIRLFRRLNAYCHQNSLSSLVIILDPSAPQIIHGSQFFPSFEDIFARIHLIQLAGIDEVLLVKFSKNDIDSSFEKFFEIVCSKVLIKELWLGSTQSLGRGPRGNFTAISQVALNNNISLLRLGRGRIRPIASEIRLCLISGNLTKAIQLIGRSPIWTRPRSGRLLLGWHSGFYKAIRINDLNSGKPGDKINVELMATSEGVSSMKWPEKTRYIQFIKGPNE